MTIALKDPTYEAIEVGETFGPLPIEMDEHYVRAATFSMDDYSPWYFRDDTELGFRLAPSAAIARDQVALFMQKYDANKVVGLHQTEEVWFSAPVRFGSTVTLTGRYIEKYRRRGKGYCTLECEAHDENGTLLVKQRSTEIMRIPENVKLGEGSSEPAPNRVAGVLPDKPVVQRASLDIAAGTPIPSLTKLVRQDQMSVFSGCALNRHTIHTDDRVSEAAGFPGTLAQGMMETCWISEMLGNFFGPSWLSTGWIKNVYLKPVFVGDRITVYGVVTGVRQGRVELEVWARNQDGLLTAAGWASARAGK